MTHRPAHDDPDTSTSLAQTIAEAAGGSQHAFEQLCISYRAPLRSIVEARLDPRLAQRLDASDVVQEALLEAYVRLRDFQNRRPMPLVQWLRETVLQQLRIAERRHRGALRRSVNFQVSYEQSSIWKLAQYMADHVTAEHRFHLKEQAEQTHRALSSLKASDREILLLRYVNGLTNVQAAEMLGISETLASKRHCRALLRLQAALNELGIDSQES